MSPLNVGGSISTGSIAERVTALEAAVAALDAALKLTVQATVDSGNRTTTAIGASRALALPDPPPLPSTLP